MPQWVEDRVDELLASPDFYPNLPSEKRRARAYGTAWNEYKKKKKKSSSDTFDGENNLLILKNSITTAREFLTDKEIEGYSMFNRIQPSRKDSLIFQAQIQSEQFRPDYEDYGFNLKKSAIVNALPRLAEEPHNILYSSHRYSDEFTIGLVHAIDTETMTAVCEVFRHDGCPQGQIVADGIETHRIPGVSTGFAITKMKCGICGAEGTPFLDCGHYPNQEVDGKINKIDIEEIRYFDLSTTALPADPEAYIFRFNSLMGLVNLTDKTYQKAIIDNNIGEEIVSDNNIGTDKLINNEPTNNNHNNNNKLEMKNMTNEKKDPNSLDEKVEQLSTQLNQLIKQNDELSKKSKGQETVINQLKQENLALGNYVRELSTEQKKSIIDEIIQLKLSCKMISEENIEQEREHLSTQDKKQLNYILTSTRKTSELLGGLDNNEPNQEFKNSNTPLRSDTINSISKLKRVLRNNEMYELVEKLKKISEREPVGGRGFKEIQEVYLEPTGKRTKGGNS